VVAGWLEAQGVELLLSPVNTELYMRLANIHTVPQNRNEGGPLVVAWWPNLHRVELLLAPVDTGVHTQLPNIAKTVLLLPLRLALPKAAHMVASGGRAAGAPLG
jgi:hypothetical protein